jgi:hypothetical protein
MPGVIFIVVSSIAALFSYVITSGDLNGIEFGIVLAVFGIMLTFWYNIKELGVADGAVVAVVQICLSVVFLVSVFILTQVGARSERKRR